MECRTTTHMDRTMVMEDGTNIRLNVFCFLDYFVAEVRGGGWKVITFMPSL